MMFSTNKERIIAFMSRELKRWYRVSEISVALNISKHVVSTMLGKLKKAKVVKKKGKYNKNTWFRLV